MYICCAKVKCFCLQGKNVKCALNPQSDERAREMHDDTAARSSCVAAACGAFDPAAACSAVCSGSYLPDKSVFAVLIDLIKMLRILPHSFINADTSCMSG